MKRDDEILLSKYIDRELNKTEREALEIRLESDPELQSALEELKNFDGLAHETFPTIPFQATATNTRPTRIWRTPLAAAAAVLFALALGAVGWAAVQGYVFSPQPQEDPAETSSHTSTFESTESRPQQSGGSTETIAASGMNLGGDGEARNAADTADEPMLRGLIENVDGEPITGATIVAATSDERVLSRARSDSLGSFELKLPLRTNSVQFDAPGYTPYFMHGVLEMFKRDLFFRMRLPRTSPVEGFVADAHGEPISGVVVTLDAGGNLVDGIQPKARTNARGGFTIDTPEGVTRLRFDHPAYAPRVARIESDGRISNVVLDPGGSLAVTVQANGSSVANAQVGLLPEERVRLRDTVRNTDETGVARFEHVPIGSYGVYARSGDDRYSGTYHIVEINSTGAEETLSLDLSPISMSVLEGKITVPPSLDMERVRVFTNNNTRFPYPSSVGVSDDGTYRMNLPIGRYEIFAFVPGDPRYRAMGDNRYVLNVGADGQTFHLDFELGEIPSHRIRLVRSDGSPITQVLMDASFLPYVSYPVVQTWLTTDDGFVDVVGDLDGVGQNVWISVYDPETGLINEHRELQEKQDTITVDYPAATISGVVTDAAGNPLSDVFIQANYLMDRDDWNPPFWRGVNVYSNAEGRFELRPAVTGVEYRFRTWKRGYHGVQYRQSVDVDARHEPRELRFTLAKADSAVEGYVVALDGTGVAGAEVHLNDARGQLWSQTESGRDGSFRLPAARMTYTVSAGTKTNLWSDSLEVTAPENNLLLVVPIATGIEHDPTSPDAQFTKEMLGDLVISFKMFASEARGERYPPLSPVKGQFSPDISRLYPEYLADEHYAARLRGDFDAKLAYLGYAVENEQTGLAFLEAYEVLGPEAMYEQDIEVGAGRGTGESDAIYQLRQGIERFLITDINDPSASSRAAAQLPVLWEMPGTRPEPGGWVLYLDGHVEWVPYPGQFPMKEAFIERLRGLMETK